MSKTSDRINKAQAGIEAGVVSLTDRLKSKGDIDENLRLLEALLFAAVEPIDVQTLRERMPEDVDVGALLARLSRDYEGRGINLCLLYTSPSPRDQRGSRMPSSA